MSPEEDRNTALDDAASTALDGAASTAPYGAWESPIDAGMIAAGALQLAEVHLDGDAVCWVEARPAEGGRHVLMRWDGASEQELTPPDLSARTLVHEYGGGAALVDGGVTVIANFADQRLYRLDGEGAPHPLTPDDGARYADLVLDRTRDRVIAVQERHPAGGGAPENRLVAVPLDGASPPVVLVEGADFYAAPRVAPDGGALAWLAWDHPRMPWDGTDLWTAPLDAVGRLGAPRHVAGGPDEAVFQPAWSPQGTLHYVTDRTGWWNLRRDDGAAGIPLFPRAVDCGQPHWVFGMATYGFLDGGAILIAGVEHGIWRLWRLPADGGAAEPIETPFTAIQFVRANAQGAAFLGASPSQADTVVRLTLDGGHTAVRTATDLAVAEGDRSVPEPIAFPTADGETAHGFYYPPANARFQAPAEERPPLLVLTHGGPTSAAMAAFNLRIQYWTSRGIGVLDLNYRGSSGYGRAYRGALDGRWGVADVEDAVHGARFLAARGDVDGARLLISGGSAGGYTTLCALTFHDAFRAGCSRYGISDLAVLAQDTHKFESRYMDGLVGPYPAAADRYRARSPLHHVERLARPVLFLQGLDDKVVPPNQSERMAEALRRAGVPVAYLPFAGEQHGFRQAETIQRALEAELFFYGQVLGFTPADPIPPFPIDNLS